MKNKILTLLLLLVFACYGNPISLQSATQSTGTWTTTAPSYDFNGTTDYIELSSNNISYQSNMTVSIWVNSAGNGEYEYEYILSGEGSGSVSDFGLIINHNDNKIYVVTEVEQAAFSTADFQFNQWNHILATIQSDGTTVIYLNSVDVTDDGSSGTPQSIVGNTYIGNRFDGARTFDGQIKGLKIWNRLLSTTEITYEYNTSWRR